MDQDQDQDQDQPDEDVTTAYLRLRRGPGLTYAVLCILVAVVDVLGFTSSLQRGSYVFALIILVLGTVAVGFLAVLSLAILVPSLVVNEARITGRLAIGKPVDVDWDDVVVDVDDDSPRGRFRLDLGSESITIDIRTWLGFREFAILVASTARPVRRLTPVARKELARLFSLDDPTAPETPETV